MFYFSFQIDEKQFCSDTCNTSSDSVKIHNIVRTNICEDILLVMFNQHYVRLYSIDWIKEKSQVLSLNGKNFYHRKVDFDYGLDQNGLPIDLVLTYQPPILFEIQCYNYVMSIGSAPIHVMYADVKKKNKLLVYNIEDKTMSGEFLLDELAVDREQVEFHPHDDGSIVNFSQSELR